MTQDAGTAIISGATGGIGRAIALELAAEGMNISFNYVRNDKAAQDLEKELIEAGVQARPFKVDIRDYSAVKSWVDATRELFGRVDIIVNNAGVIKDKALALMQPDDWHDVISTNLEGTIHLTRAAIVDFIKRKSGVVINITSVSGLTGIARQTNYAASKAGVIGFTKSLAKEVGAYNIRVNSVAPGFIDTEMLKDLNEEYMQEIKKQIPLSRFGRPEEVAKMVGFLVSEDSAYITGQTFVIDGGLSMV